MSYVGEEKMLSSMRSRFESKIWKHKKYLKDKAYYKLI